MRRLSVALCGLVLVAAAGTSAVGQQNQDQNPNPNQMPKLNEAPKQNEPTDQQPQKPGPQPTPGPAAIDFEARIDPTAIEAAFGRKKIATAGLSWTCETVQGLLLPAICTATGTPQLFSISTCRQLASRLGPVTAFRGGARGLSGSELKRCNAGVQQADLPGPGDPSQPGGFVPQPGQSGFVPVGEDDAPAPGFIDGIQLPEGLGPTLGEPVVPRLPDLRCDGPDPAVVKLTIYFFPSLTDPENQISAYFALNDSIANVGRAEWVSAEGQQFMSTTREPAGGPVRLLAGIQPDFPRLAPGESAPSEYGGGWFGPPDADFYPGETTDEFADDPPGMGIRIVYDPDIRIDGNPQNDDCNMDNNALSVTGAQLAQWARDGREIIEVTRDGNVTFSTPES